MEKTNSNKNKARRIKYGKEPVLHAHRYIVLIIRKSGKTGVAYCENLDGVRERVESAPVGSVVEVYTATHNFREAWEK